MNVRFVVVYRDGRTMEGLLAAPDQDTAAGLVQSILTRDEVAAVRLWRRHDWTRPLSELGDPDEVVTK